MHAGLGLGYLCCVKVRVGDGYQLFEKLETCCEKPAPSHSRTGKIGTTHAGSRSADCTSCVLEQYRNTRAVQYILLLDYYMSEEFDQGMC